MKVCPVEDKSTTLIAKGITSVKDPIRGSTTISAWMRETDWCAVRICAVCARPTWALPGRKESFWCVPLCTRIQPIPSNGQWFVHVGMRREQIQWSGM
mmetsp:Transcript_71573/g.141993  ORF Transcript_71573/g.141993 Transcript_71573/m.141993 type:complete len:98 (+) Transcript_71573:2210-2503(+)